MVGPIDSAFSGLCIVQMMSPVASSCRGLAEILDCARQKCGFDACATQCSDYIQCLEAADDPCIASISACTHGEPCLTCQTNLQGCIWIDKCSGIFTCGSTTEGGPCTKLEACCKTQRDPTACSGFVSQFSMIGGDTSCQMLIDDRTGFRVAYTNDPPCML